MRDFASPSTGNITTNVVQNMGILTASVNAMAIFFGSVGNLFVVHIIVKLPKLRDAETPIHLVHTVYSFLILCVCGPHDIAEVLNLKHVSVFECSIFQCTNNSLRLAFSLTLVFLLIARCKTVLSEGAAIRQRCGIACIIIVNVFIVMIGIMWTKAEVNNLEDCTLMPSEVYKRYSYFPLSVELILVFIVITAFCLSYGKLYLNQTKLVGAREVTLKIFLKKERNGVLTCSFLATILISSLMPLVILQIWLLSGYDVSFTTFKMCIASVRLSLSFQPFVFFLMTDRYRRIFLRCLRGCFANPSFVDIH